MDSVLFKIALAFSFVTESDEETKIVDCEVEICKDKEVITLPKGALSNEIEKIVAKELGVVISNLFIDKKLEEENAVEGVDFIYMEAAGKPVKVFFNQMVHIIKEGNFTVTTLLNKKQFVSYNKLNWFAKVLPANDFLQIHRSNIIRMKFVNSYIDNIRTGIAIMIDERELMVANRKKEEFEKRYERIKKLRS